LFVPNASETEPDKLLMAVQPFDSANAGTVLNTVNAATATPARSHWPNDIRRIHHPVLRLLSSSYW
jgi:hypothetical protein